MQALAAETTDILIAEAGPGSRRSDPVYRKARNLIVEAWPLNGQPGVATVTILDGPLNGQLTQATDGNAKRANLTSHSKWLVKGILALVACQLDVASGGWAIWVTWTDEASDRDDYYDRNPGVVSGANTTYSGTVAGGGGLVTLWTYTVPANRKAFVESAVCALMINGAPTSAWLRELYIQVIPAGLTAATFVGAELMSVTPGALDRDRASSLGYLGPGDELLSIYYDHGTDGSVLVKSFAKVTEFDA